MRKFLILALCLALAGCATPASQIVKPFVEPQYGMTKLQMFDLLGKPDHMEIYKKTDLSLVEFYVYIKKYGDSQENVPVCVVGNRVVGWGKTYYQDHVSQDDTRIK